MLETQRSRCSFFCCYRAAVLSPCVCDADSDSKATHRKSELPRDADLLGWPGASWEGLRTVFCWGVQVWEERGDVGDGGQQKRASLGAFVLGQRDDYVVLVPHVEGVVADRMR